MVFKKPTLARIKIKFPEKIWISEIFKSFKDIRMEIISFLPYDLEKSIGNAMIEIMHYNIESMIELIKNHKSVHDFKILEKEKNSIKFNIKTKDPYLLYGVIKYGVLVDFPINIREGYAYWRLVSTREGIDNLLDFFEKMNLDYTLLKIGNSPYSIEDEKKKLNLDEMEILDKALEYGFFEIPRKISLENLAKTLGKSKSALSVMLRKIIRKKIILKD